MLIGELAKETGLSKDTIRFYEKLGLIEASERHAGTRIYKEFSPDMQERLVLIGQGKSLGFTLTEMKHLLYSLGEITISAAEKLQIIERKLAEVAEKMQHLEDIKTRLSEKRDRLKREIKAHKTPFLGLNV